MLFDTISNALLDLAGLAYSIGSWEPFPKSGRENLVSFLVPSEGGCPLQITLERVESVFAY